VPRSSHAGWSPPDGRPDPVELIMSQDTGRLPGLVPIRHERMAESPFAFYRGAAKIMASDLSGTPVSGLNTQLCGDAHLANFGSYASPERRQVFDVSDFDETLPGPWEWDIKRLATSFVLAGRENEAGAAATREAVVHSVEAYRQAMAEFADAATLDIWYSQLTLERIQQALPAKQDRRFAAKRWKKAHSKGHLKAFTKLAERVGGEYRIKSHPPLLLPLRDLAHLGSLFEPDELRRAAEETVASYHLTLSDDRQLLFKRYQVVDVALKVVGVGSVGTRCMIVLFQGRDQDDPLFLQVKEASSSVLEDHLPRSRYPEPGQRVVEGQRLMQASSDAFLGWTSQSRTGHDYYWRQFHDMKGSTNVAAMNPRRLRHYAGICGWTLAHAHARSGDPIAIAGYLGSGSAFDRAVGDFAFRYADQNDRDYRAFVAAIGTGRATSEPD
jgi:uncharacterized protein (DUF2252 family)